MLLISVMRSRYTKNVKLDLLPKKSHVFNVIANGIMTPLLSTKLSPMTTTGSVNDIMIIKSTSLYFWITIVTLRNSHECPQTVKSVEIVCVFTFLGFSVTRN